MQQSCNAQWRGPMWRTARGGGPGGRSKMVRKFNFRKNLALEQLQLLHKATSNPPAPLSLHSFIFLTPFNPFGTPLAPWTPLLSLLLHFGASVLIAVTWQGDKQKDVPSAKWIRGVHGRGLLGEVMADALPHPVLFFFLARSRWWFNFGASAICQGVVHWGWGLGSSQIVSYCTHTPLRSTTVISDSFKVFACENFQARFSSARVFPYIGFLLHIFPFCSSVSRFDTPYSTEWRACDIFRFNKVNLG